MSTHIRFGTAGVVALVISVALSADSLIDRWADAIGGREALSKVHVIYREATIQVAGLTGTIKTWHNANGQYRKEEKVGPYETVEVFDGTNDVFQQAPGAPQRLVGADLQRARSTAFANANVLFYVFFPEKRHGDLIVDGTHILLRPEGGIDWHVVLDPSAALPQTMSHQDGDKTITVTFVSYETVDGITLEHEIHRTTGDPRFTSDIRFTKTVINPAVDSRMFAIESVAAVR